MPRLPVPQSRPTLPQAIFTPDSQGAAQARAQGEFADTVQRGGVQLARQLQERKTQKEISQLNAEFAKAQAELTVEWQETLRTADPNDDTVAATFREGAIAQRLEALQSFANTRESKAYFERAAAGLSSGFLVSTEAGQQNLRETAAVQNWNTSVNQMGDAVTADPLSFDNTLAMIDLQTEGLVQSSGLSRQKALVLQTQARQSLAMAAGYGMIDRDPEMGREMVESGRFSEYIDAKDKSNLLAYADRQEAAKNAAAKKRREEAAAEAQVEAMARAMNADGTINTAELPRLQGELIRNPALRQEPESLRAMLNHLDGMAEDAIEGVRFGETDPVVFNSIIDRAALPPGHPDRPTSNEVYLLSKRGLSTSDANHIVNNILNQKGSVAEQIGNTLRSSSLKAASARLTGSSALEFADDPSKVENYNRFVRFATLNEHHMKQQGKTPEEIWAIDGPIMSRLAEFDQRVDPLEAISLEREQFDGPFPEFQGEDPSTFGRRSAPSFNNKPLNRLSPNEMDAWLKEN